jgi:hypothetical protein
MPTAGFDDNLNLPSGNSRFIKLKAKGDKIKFRIASTPQYQTIHFIGDKKTEICARYNGGDPKAFCQYCEQAQKLMDSGKEEEGKKLAPTTNFFYPIVNMDTNEAQIFKFTAKGIHYNIKGYSDEGVDVFACTWSVERTEDPGNYYVIKRLDEKALTEAQSKAYEVAKHFDLKAKLSSSVVLEEETGSVK